MLGLLPGPCLGPVAESLSVSCSIALGQEASATLGRVGHLSLVVSLCQGGSRKVFPLFSLRRGLELTLSWGFPRAEEPRTRWLPEALTTPAALDKGGVFGFI